MGSNRERGKKELEAIGDKIYSPPHFTIYFPNIISIQKYIKKFRPDAILVDSTGRECLIAFILSKINNLSYFIFIRGDKKEEFNECLSFKSFFKKVLAIIDFNVYFFLLKRAKAIFTVSNYLNKKVGYQINMPQKEIITAYPTIDLKRFHPYHDPYIFKKFFGIPQETRILLTVMNFTFPNKVRGLLYFIETIGEVLKEHKNLKYIIVGDGRLRVFVERKVEKMGLTDSILLLGFVKEIEKAYASSELLIHTSFLETAGLIILEAGASGKPVIVNRCGGMPELVEDGNTGFIVGKTDCTELKEKIIELLENDELRYNMGINARKRIEKMHNRKKIGNIYSQKIREYI